MENLAVAGIRVVNPFPVYQDKARRRCDIYKVADKRRSAVDKDGQIARIELELLNEVRRVIGVAAHSVLRDTYARHLKAERVNLSGADIQSMAPQTRKQTIGRIIRSGVDNEWLKRAVGEKAFGIQWI